MNTLYNQRALHRTARPLTDLQYKPISKNYSAQQDIEPKQRLPKIPGTSNYRKWTNTQFLAQNRDSTTKTKTSRTVAQSPGFEDQKEAFRIILANRISLPTFLLPQIQKFSSFVFASESVITQLTETQEKSALFSRRGSYTVFTITMKL